MTIRMQATYLLLTLLALIAMFNFYIFARATIDDAFITWRYGKNLIEAGIWGYNPTSFDLTQAYTNPIYAVLSIIPAWLRIDTVLFFKLVSCASLLLPVWLVCRPGMDKMRFALVYLLILALPATMVHAFGGLETFVFVVLLAGLFVALLEVRFLAAVVLTLSLSLVRPEAWVLIGLVPAYMFFTPAFAPCFRRAVLAGGLLSGGFGVYALFHFLHFGYVLPNTFYVKTGQPFNLNVAIYFLAYTAPAFVLLLTRHWRLFVLMILFYLPMIVSYASATLMMNYSARFAFHIWGATSLLAAYVIAAPIQKRRLLGRGADFWGVLALLASTGLIMVYSVSVPAFVLSLVGAQRAQHGHIALGKTLHNIAKRYDIDTYAVSDAGADPFHSGLIAYDSIGLGSSLVAHKGASREVIEQYQPDLAIISLRDGKSYLPGEQPLIAWLKEKHFRPLCEVVQWPGRSLQLYTHGDIPELREVCNKSAHANGVDNERLLNQELRTPPWRYWRE